MSAQVQLGFTVPGGEPYYISVAHTVITGMTEFGKTTAEEAVFNRLPADSKKCLVFLTKRGEKVFTNHDAPTLKPFYRERFDWEYMRSLLESSMKERLKFETPWIIRVCKLARVSLDQQLGRDAVILPGVGLKEARRIIDSALKEGKIRDFDKNMYILLGAYLDKVIPLFEKAQYKFVDTLTLKPGINVMDLTEWYVHEEMQFLIIRSCMQEILEKGNNVIIGLPEAWKLLPQGRNTPVKLYFEKFVREGATNGNYLFIDAQDLGGVDKAPLRQVRIWIMGHMQEANEVERLLKQTLGVDVPAREIQTLPLGHFLVAAGDEVTKVYVWPNGVPEGMAMAVAKGALAPEKVKEYLQQTHGALLEMFPGRHVVSPEEVTGELSGRIEDLGRRVDALSRRCDNITSDRSIDALKKRLDDVDLVLEKAIPSLRRLLENSSSLSIEHEGMQVKIVDKGDRVVKASTSNIEGKLLYCIVKELPAEGFSTKELESKLVEHGWTVKDTTLSTKLSIMTSQGKLVKTDKGYRLPTKVNFIVE